MIITYKREITEADKAKQGIGQRFITMEAMDHDFGRIGGLVPPTDLKLAKRKNRICQVFWSEPYKMPFDTARWSVGYQFELTIPLCALSLAILKEHGQEVVMYTDTVGEHTLCDLGYDRIYNIFDPVKVNTNFWAAGKIIAMQNEPLDSLQIDTDIFVYNGEILDKAFFEPVVGSHAEDTTRYKPVLDFGVGVFDHLKGKETEWSTNCGFLKCHDISKKLRFISAYWEGTRTKIVLDALDGFTKSGKGAFCADLLIEQFNFHNICNPMHLVKIPPLASEFQDFCHLISFEKYMKVPLVMDILKEYFPKYYQAVLDAWKKNDFGLMMEDQLYT